jgi:hypothetical protein
MRKILGVLTVTMAISALTTFGVPAVHAASVENVALPLSCEPSKGLYKETSIIVVVPLDSLLLNTVGSDAQEFARNLFYEFTYIRENNAAPLNAIVVNGKVYNISCDLKEYQVNVVGGGTTGRYVIGVVGNTGVDEVQSIIDANKFSTVKQASLVMSDEQKNTTIALANEGPCIAEFCKKLVPNKEGITKRAYKLIVGEPNYTKSIRQKEQLSFSLIVRNDGEYPVFSNGIAPLTLQTTKSGVSQLYHSSWVSPGIVSKLTDVLMPNSETTIAVTIAGPLVPGKYSESLQLKLGNTPVGEKIALSFTVESDNLKLGRITSKDTTPYANMRQTPSMNGPIMGKLDVGTYVIIRGYQDAWVKIETKEGRTGWVYKPFIREL